MGTAIIERSHVGRNRSDCDDWVEKSYYTTIRRFANCGVEVMTRRINPLQYKRYAESAAMGGLVSFKDRPGGLEKTEEEKQLESFRVSTRRAKQAVRWAIKSIGADHLLTLTYRSPEDSVMDDFDRLKGDWKDMCRLVRKGLPAVGAMRKHSGIKVWRFVAVPEFQDNGAYHLHIAVVGRQDISFLRRCWYVASGGAQDATGSDTPGAVNVKGPSKRWGAKAGDWRPNKLAGYMTKYLAKTFEQTVHPKGSKRYWAGRSNEKPEVEQYWLKAQDFVSAILESHGIFASQSKGVGVQIWAAQGYDSVWFSG